MIEISLPVYDNTGIQVDTTTVMLNREQVEDIVNCATQVIYSDRLRQDVGIMIDDESLLQSLAELDEAMTACGAIEGENYYPGT